MKVILFIFFYSLVCTKYCLYDRKFKPYFGFMLLHQLNTLVVVAGKNMASKVVTSEETCEFLWKPPSSSQSCIQVIYDKKLTWYAAKDFCALQNGYLVEILERKKNTFIEATLGRVKQENRKYFRGSTTKLWIGFRNDLYDYNLYVWDRNKTEVTFFQSRALTLPERDKCGQFGYSTMSKNMWLMRKCRSKAMFICECDAGKRGYCTMDRHDSVSTDTCDPPCDNTQFDPPDESSKETCDAGFYGPDCDMVCVNNTYGPGCQEKCSPQCGGVDGECHPLNGSCLETCKTGFNGTKCDTEAKCEFLWEPNTTSTSCIKVIYTKKVTWYEAKNLCALEKGYLVEIMDKKKNDFIKEILGKTELANSNYFGGNVYLWIGIRNNVSRTYSWVWDRSNTEVTGNVKGTRASLGDPNDDRCGLFLFSHMIPNMWVSIECSSKAMAICEVPIDTRRLVNLNKKLLHNATALTTQLPSHHYPKNSSEKCQPPCEPLCDPPCNETRGKCHPSNKSCVEKCDAGFHGPECDIACSNQTYGPGCLEKCSPHCGGINKECHPSNGYCVETCEAGFNGFKCDTVCTNNTYGSECTKKCSPHCGGISGECHSANGSCVETCEEGFRGLKCDIPSLGPEQNSSQKRGYAVVVSMLAIAFITLFFFSLVFAGCLVDDQSSEAKGQESESAPGEDFEYQVCAAEDGQVRQDLLKASELTFEEEADIIRRIATVMQSANMSAQLNWKSSGNKESTLKNESIRPSAVEL